MCIPPADADPTPHFQLLAGIAERNGLVGLSMGDERRFRGGDCLRGDPRAGRFGDFRGAGLTAHDQPRCPVSSCARSSADLPGRRQRSPRWGGAVCASDAERSQTRVRALHRASCSRSSGPDHRGGRRETSARERTRDRANLIHDYRQDRQDHRTRYRRGGSGEGEMHGASGQAVVPRDTRSDDPPDADRCRAIAFNLVAADTPASGGAWQAAAAEASAPSGDDQIGWLHSRCPDFCAFTSR